MGALPAISMKPAAACSACMGSPRYSPCSHSGSVRIETITRSRHTRLRPAIGAGRQASGIAASMNPGYRSIQSQACMIDAQALGQQGILRAHHVLISVLREVRMQAIARLARGAVSHGVREDN